MRPKGSGGAGTSATLALLDDMPVSPASRRLASVPAALGTRPIVLSPRAVKRVSWRLIPFLFLCDIIAYNLGGFVGPTIVGYIKQATGSYEGAVTVLGSALVVLACLASALRSGAGQPHTET
jgi:hypothetical protein